MAWMSFFRRQHPISRKPNTSRRLLLEVLEDRTVPSSLQLSVSPHALVEGASAMGTVTRIGTDNSQPLTVNLVSSDTTEATVPAYVVIPAGQASASFGITAVNDFMSDGVQNVTITGTAALPTHVQPDATFAGSGSVLLGSITQDVALQPDGKIVTAGMRYNGGTSNPYDFAVSRFRTDGSPDTSFGGSGTVYTDVSGQSDRAQAVVLQPDGKIVVAGTGGNGPHFFYVLARYNPNGTLDTTFGSGGKIVTDPNPGGTYNEIWDVALQPDGRILAAGNVSAGSTTQFAVARYNPNGALDTTFGSNGIATTGAANRAYSVLVQPDGRIVLAGAVAEGNSNSHFALARFYSWGAVDSTFGAGGTVITDLPGYYEEAFDAALQPDGKIVAVGQTSPSGGPNNFALARYNPDGSLDSTFGAGGFVTTEMGGNDQAKGVALSPDGRILVVGGGVSTSNSTMYTVVADYNADGSLTLGYISRNYGIQGQALAIQPDGKVVTVSSQNTAFGGYLDRYEPMMLISGSDSLTVQDNTTPVIQPDAYDVGEDQTFYSYYSSSYGVLSNDFSPNGSLSASLVSGPAHGTLYLNPDGSFSYTPAPNYNGPDSFVYQATDSLGVCGQATVTLTVWPMDDPIFLSVPGPQTMAEDTSKTFSVANGNAITITDADQPRVLVGVFVQNAIVTLTNTAGLQFYPGYPNNSAGVGFYADTPAAATAALNGLIVTPNPNYNGTIYMNVFAQDTTAGSSYYATASLNVNITVTPVNDPPVAIGDSFQPYEDMTFNSYTSVLSNDSDPEWDPLTAVLVSGPAHGTLTLNANGNFTYLAAPNYYGPDSFTYSARDSGGLLSAPATVTLNVWPVDDPIQVTAPGPQTIAEDTSFTFSSANGTAITVTDIESPQVLVSVFVQNGILSLGSTAGLTFDPAGLNNTAHVTFYANSPAVANAALDGMVFTPDANFNGTVYFNVWVQDQTIVSYSVSASAYTNITVTPVNDAPVAANDAYAAQAGVPLVTYAYGGGTQGVLANDTDVDWNSLSAVLVSGPTHGSLTLNSDGSFTYTADSGYTGSDSFTYYAFDGQLRSGLATVTFTVTINQPPVSAGDAYSVNEDTTLSVPAPGVLGNDSDPEGATLTAQLVSGPAHGTLTLNADGSFTYTPAANYNGPDTFSYRASDGVNLGDPVTVTLTVNAVNDAPVASNDSYSVNEDVVLTVAAPGVLSNDTDVDSPTLSAVLVSGSSHGVLSLNADGSFSYTPSANYNGPDSFTYKANDGQADSSVVTVSITVSSVNDAPVAVNDAYTLNEDQTLNVAPTAGVTSLNMVSQPGDYIGQGHSYSFTPQTGTFMANRNFDNGVSIFYSGNGEFWTLDFAAPGDVPLTPGTYLNATRWPFQASGVPGLDVSGDGRGSNTLTGSFTVLQALYAADGSVLRFDATFEQHSEGFAPALTGEIKFNVGAGPSGILLNDSDVEGSPLTISIVSNPAHGTLSMNVDGSFKYTPAANYNGADSFTYKVSDGNLDSNVATVALTINPVNDFPTANSDFYVTAEDNVLTVAAPGVLANDSDVDGDPLTATLVTSTTHGSLVFNANGSFTYTPQANYNGSDLFQYAAFDGTSFSFIRSVNITVTSVNDAPTAGNDSYTTAEDTPLTVSAAGVLGNDTDVENSALSAILVSGPAHGILTLNSNGSFTYTPDANYNGPDSFTYKANDGSLNSNVATVSLTVTAVNDAPVAGADSFGTAEDVTLNGNVLGNDSDVDGNTLSATLVSGPAHGSLTLNADGSFSYTPAANYNGPDSFTYKANDGGLDSNVATVSITVTAVNDAPVAGNDSFTTNEDTALNGNVAGNDNDVEGSALSANLVSGPAHGSLTLNADGSFTYTPAANYNGSDSFTYKVSDGALDSNVATVSITVTAVNDAPVAGTDSYTTTEDTTLNGNVLGNDSDVDGNTLSALVVSGPAHGSLALNADGSFSYTPTANYNGPDSFTYKANDGGLDSNVATVSLTVTPVNDAPVAANDSFTTNEDTTLNGNVLGNDSDVDSSTLSATLIVGPAHGTLTLNGDGSFTYTPAANYNGTDSFTYKANDGSLDSNVATVSITVAPVNDAPVAGDNAFSTSEDTPLSVGMPGVLANDSDVEGSALSAILVSGPAHGSFTLNANGSFTYTPAANYNGPDSFAYKASDGGLDSNVATVTLTVTPVNDAPSVNAGPNQTVNENTTVSFSATASDVDGDTLSYLWNFGDGATSTSTTPTHVYADNGVFMVTLNVNDGHGGSTNTSLVVTVNNVAPTASVSGPATGARGQMRTFTLGAVDPSAVDQAGSFTFNINWGDGNSQPSTGAASQQVGHIYAASGTFTVQVTATDKDGGVSTIAQQSITINAIDLQAGSLVIGGTTADDNIAINPADAAGNLAVTINGASQGTFASPAQIVVYGQAGNDQIKLNTKKIGSTTYYVAIPAALFGDAGNDTLDARGSTANNILVGGAGTDTLQGGSGRDLLIGGAGTDTLHGNGGDDIIIGNATDFDTNLAALNAVMAEWGRTDADYATRINHLNGSAGGGLNAAYFLNNNTVHEDAAIDQLYGEAGNDWFFYTASGSNKDKLNDLATGEVATGP